jgi:hypothetical protein
MRAHLLAMRVEKKALRQKAKGRSGLEEFSVASGRQVFRLRLGREGRPRHGAKGAR